MLLLFFAFITMAIAEDHTHTPGVIQRLTLTSLYLSTRVSSMFNLYSPINTRHPGQLYVDLERLETALWNWTNELCAYGK